MEERIKREERESRDSFVETATLMIYMYLPPAMIPQDIGSLTMDELYRFLAMAKICREMVREDIQAGIAQAFPKKE